MGLMWRSEGSFVELVLFFGLSIGPADLLNSGCQLYVASDLLAEIFFPTQNLKEKQSEII